MKFQKKILKMAALYEKEDLAKKKKKFRVGKIAENSKIKLILIHNFNE